MPQPGPALPALGRGGPDTHRGPCPGGGWLGVIGAWEVVERPRGRVLAASSQPQTWEGRGAASPSL